MQTFKKFYRVPNRMRLFCAIFGSFSLIGIIALAQSNPLLVTLPVMATAFCLSIAAIGRPPQDAVQKIDENKSIFLMMLKSDTQKND